MITFSLVRSDKPDGKVAILLHLYRGGKIAAVTTIATVAPHEVRGLFTSARLHLAKLGVHDASESCLRAAS